MLEKRSSPPYQRRGCARSRSSSRRTAPERIQQFAHELRARQHANPLPTRLERQIVSPSAELVVSRDCSAYCVVRDTRAAGEGDRFRWTVAVLGQLGPITEGRAENRVEPARPAGGNVRLSER